LKVPPGLNKKGGIFQIRPFSPNVEGNYTPPTPTHSLLKIRRRKVNDPLNDVILE